MLLLLGSKLLRSIKNLLWGQECLPNVIPFKIKHWQWLCQDRRIQHLLPCQSQPWPNHSSNRNSPKTIQLLQYHFLTELKPKLAIKWFKILQFTTKNVFLIVDRMTVPIWCLITNNWMPFNVWVTVLQIILILWDFSVLLCVHMVTLRTALATFVIKLNFVARLATHVQQILIKQCVQDALQHWLNP